jgi:hypothetical protein
MGSKTRKTRCTTPYVCDSNTEERSIKLWSILGVLPCLILRIWRLRTRTKNEYTMDDFSMLTIREPWLLKRKNSTSIVSTWLAGKELMLQDRRDSRQGTNLSEILIDHYKEGRLMTGFQKLWYERWLQVGTSRNNLAHTFTYFANFEVLKTRCFESVTLFKVDAMRMLVQYGAHDAC